MLWGGGGGGGGVHPDFFVKIDLEIAIDQQTKAVTELLRGSRTPGAHRCPRDSHAHFWSKLCPIMPKHLNMLITKILGALLVASGPLNSYKNFH